MSNEATLREMNSYYNYNTSTFFSSNENLAFLHGDNFMAIFTTLSVVIRFSTGPLGIFATLIYVFTIRHTEYGNNNHTIDFLTVL